MGAGSINKASGLVKRRSRPTASQLRNRLQGLRSCARIINRSGSSRAIMTLIRMATLVHRVLGKPIELEIVLVD